MWRATISADEPAGNVNGPAMGQTERVQAGADPSAQRIHKENWRARHGSGAGESCTISLSHRRQAHRGLSCQTSLTPRWPRERRPPSPAPTAALAHLPPKPAASTAAARRERRAPLPLQCGGPRRWTLPPGRRHAPLLECRPARQAANSRSPSQEPHTPCPAAEDPACSASRPDPMAKSLCLARSSPRRQRCSCQCNSGEGPGRPASPPPMRAFKAVRPSE